MILTLFSYVITGLFLVCLLTCIALGLLEVSKFIENHSRLAKIIGLRLVYATVLVQLLIILLDSVPFWPFLPNLLSAVIHLESISSINWPFSSASPSPSSRSLRRMFLRLLSLVLPLCSHFWLMSHHKKVSNTWHLHIYNHHVRERLPGGRLDWDVESSPPQERELSLLELFAILGFCVWTVPIWRFLGKCAAIEWTLPVTHNGLSRQGGKDDRQS